MAKQNRKTLEEVEKAVEQTMYELIEVEDKLAELKLEMALLLCQEDSDYFVMRVKLSIGDLSCARMDNSCTITISDGDNEFTKVVDDVLARNPDTEYACGHYLVNVLSLASQLGRTEMRCFNDIVRHIQNEIDSHNLCCFACQ